MFNSNRLGKDYTDMSSSELRAAKAQSLIEDLNEAKAEFNALTELELAIKYCEEVEETIYESTTGKFYTWSTYWEEQLREDLQGQILKFLEHRASSSLTEKVIYCLKSTFVTREMNTEQGLVPFSNGTYNLKTNVLEAHNKLDYFNWQLPRAYNPEAKEFPVISSFLKSLANDNVELQAVFEALASMIFKRDLSLQKAAVLTGVGSNGKGVYTHLLELLVGDENTTAVSLQDLQNNRFTTVSLLNKSLCTFTDADTYPGNVGTFKAITGGDKVSIEPKMKPSFSRVIPISMLIATNKTVFVGNQDTGLQRRLLYLPCDAIIAEENKRDLIPELEQELEAFTNYLLALDHKSIILGAKKIKAIANKTNELEAAGDSGIAFFHDKLILDPKSQIQSSHLHDLYVAYCQKEQCHPKKGKRFSMELEAWFLVNNYPVQKSHTKAGSVFVGLKLV